MDCKRLKLPIGIQCFKESLLKMTRDIAKRLSVTVSDTQLPGDLMGELISATAQKYEQWLFRSSILSFLQGCGVVVASEMHTNRGRPDLVVSYRDNVWVIEIKIAHEGESATEKAQEAYRQIMDKNYAEPYPNAVRLGLGIDETARQITEFCCQ